LGIAKAFVNGSQDFKDELKPETARQDGVWGVERGAEAFADLPETLNDKTSRVCVRDVVQGEGTVDVDGVGEGILGQNFCEGFE
jgi:hypothetical protein